MIIMNDLIQLAKSALEVAHVGVEVLSRRGQKLNSFSEARFCIQIFIAAKFMVAALDLANLWHALQVQPLKKMQVLMRGECTQVCLYKQLHDPLKLRVIPPIHETTLKKLEKDFKKTFARQPLTSKDKVVGLRLMMWGHYLQNQNP